MVSVRTTVVRTEKRSRCEKHLKVELAELSDILHTSIRRGKESNMTL